jgi:hypothetical protein
MDIRERIQSINKNALEIFADNKLFYLEQTKDNNIQSIIDRIMYIKKLIDINNGEKNKNSENNLIKELYDLHIMLSFLIKDTIALSNNNKDNNLFPRLK